MNITIIDLNRKIIPITIYGDHCVGEFLTYMDLNYGWKKDKLHLCCEGRSLNNNEHFVFSLL